jgi:hypothetical protein
MTKKKRAEIRKAVVAAFERLWFKNDCENAPWPDMADAAIDVILKDAEGHFGDMKRKLKSTGVPPRCKRHSSDSIVLCNFPESSWKQCHQCGSITEREPPPSGLEGAITYCSDHCDQAWREEHPGYWTPIEETLPGGRYDGIWENSGFQLGGAE